MISKLQQELVQERVKTNRLAIYQNVINDFDAKYENDSNHKNPKAIFCSLD